VKSPFHLTNNSLGHQTASYTLTLACPPSISLKKTPTGYFSNSTTVHSSATSQRLILPIHKAPTAAISAAPRLNKEVTTTSSIKQKQPHRLLH